MLPSALKAQARGIVTQQVTERSVGVYSVVRTLTPANSNKPINLIYLINCRDGTQVTYNANTQQWQIGAYRTRLGASHNSLPTWQYKFCKAKGFEV